MEIQNKYVLDQYSYELVWCTCKLLVTLYDLYLLHFESYCMWYIEWINSTMGITPNISIMLLYTFYQPVFYATHDQHFPSESEEQAAFWVGFGEHCGDDKLLDKNIQQIIYRSADGQSPQPIPTIDLK